MASSWSAPTGTDLWSLGIQGSDPDRLPYLSHILTVHIWILVYLLVLFVSYPEAELVWNETFRLFSFTFFFLYTFLWNISSLYSFFFFLYANSISKLSTLLAGERSNRKTNLNLCSCLFWQRKEDVRGSRNAKPFRKSSGSHLRAGKREYTTSLIKLYILFSTLFFFVLHRWGKQGNVSDFLGRIATGPTG